MTKIPKTRPRDDALADVRSAIKQRDALALHIDKELSNKALAKRFDVHVATIQRFIRHEEARKELRATGAHKC